MPVPSPRDKILPARGNYADLASNVASLVDGEICYAIDQDQYYQNEGGDLVAVGATKAQGLLADSAVQPGDNVSDLANDAGYITSAGAPVQSVAGKTGVVTLAKADVTDFSDADYATAAQGILADSATQPGDNISTLTNDAGYITSAGAPVQSVNTKSGAVVLNADDIDDTSTTHKFASQAELTKLAGIATGAEVNVNADWNAVSGDAEILNKPTLVTDLDGLSDVTLVAPSNGQVLKYNGSLWVNDTASGSIPDGDKGDITVSSGGTVWTVNDDAVTYAKIQDVSATDRLLGRSTAGAGDVEEITCTAAGRAILDDVDAAAQRTTLGLGTIATLAAPSGSVVGTTDTQTLTNKTLGDLKETVFTITDGTGVDLNPANGPIQVWTLEASRAPTASSFAAGQSMTLMVADGTAYTVTWPSVVWVGGSAPTLATTGYTVVELWKVSTTLYGAIVGDVA